MADSTAVELTLFYPLSAESQAGLRVDLDRGRDRGAPTSHHFTETPPETVSGTPGVK